MFKNLFAAFVLLILCFSAFSAPAIEIGDPAPELKIARWVKGEPVDLAHGRGKNIYVVEFWATWCPPCRETIPKLTEIQAKFKDEGVVIIGISSEESFDKVKEFVDSKADTMTYTVAFDDNRETSRRYMEAFQQSGIPYAFVVDRKGNIVWHGHPMQNLEAVLEAVVKDKFDGAAMQKTEAGKSLLPVYFFLLSRTKEKDIATTVAQRILSYADKDAEILEQLAMISMGEEQVPEDMRNVELALTAARSAYELSGDKSFSPCNTYARALFLSGKVAEAVEIQEKAVRLAAGENQEVRNALAEYLAEYRKALSGAKPGTSSPDNEVKE